MRPTSLSILVTDHLKAFFQANGHVSVPTDFVARDGFPLGLYCAYLRHCYQHRELSDGQISELESFGFEWEPRDPFFESTLLGLKQFEAEFGHVNVPDDYVISQPHPFPLGYRCKTLRERFKKGLLLFEQIATLRRLGFDLSPSSDSVFIADAISRLRSFLQDHGRAPLSPDLVVGGGKTFATYYNGLRRCHKKGLLNEQHLADLEAMGIRVQLSLADLLAIDQSVVRLRAFYQAHGHLAVPREYRDPEGVRISSDCLFLRHRCEKGVLTAQQVAELAAMDFVFAQKDYTANVETIAHLRVFARTHGHTDVPPSYVSSDGFPLGPRARLLLRRHLRGQLAPWERAELSEIGFVKDMRGQAVPREETSGSEQRTARRGRSKKVGVSDDLRKPYRRVFWLTAEEEAALQLALDRLRAPAESTESVAASPAPPSASSSPDAVSIPIPSGGLAPVHPGELLRARIPKGISVQEAARKLGISRVICSKILNSKARITANIAVRLENWLGTPAEVWANAQAVWDVWQERAGTG